MKLNDLHSPNSTKAPKRLGRGIGSGLGKTSGKGHKGQNARSGGGVRPGFEGGQMPLLRRLPKVGFTNIFDKKYTVVNIASFEQFPADSKITADFLKKNGVVNKVAPYGIKVLGNGNITKSFTVVCNKISKSAEEKIVKAGGKVEVK